MEFSSKAYKNDSNPDVYNNCNFFNPPPANKTCGIDLNQFNPCVNLYGYGLRQGSPCIFLKLKADADFKPQFHNVSDLPEAMPVDLKTDIQYYIRNNPVYSVRKTNSIVTTLGARIICSNECSSS